MNAIECVSEYQERAWYDSHRASLVPEPDAATVFEEIRRGTGIATEGRKPTMRGNGVNANHLMPFFLASSWKGFDDSDSVSLASELS